MTDQTVHEITDFNQISEYLSGKNHMISQYRFLFYWNKICEKFNVTYWITGGTALGALRNNGIIPWDDDFDICVLEKDWDTIRSNYFIKTFKNLDYFLRIDLLGRREKVTTVFTGIKYGKTFTKDKFLGDIFCCYFDKTDKKIKLSNKHFRNIFIHEYIDYELFSKPFKDYKLGPITIKGLNDYTDYCKRTYGEKCFSEGKIFNFHREISHKEKENAKEIIIKGDLLTKNYYDNNDLLL